MKKIILLIGMALISVFGSAQMEWALPSSKWVYHGKPDHPNFVEINFKKDTTLLGKNAIVLSKDRHTLNEFTSEIMITNIGDEILLVEDSTVYLYVSNDFDTLYTFNAKIGDTWVLNCDQYLGESEKNATITLVDYGSTTIENSEMLYLVLNYSFDSIIIGDIPYTFNDTVIEKIGSTSLFFQPCEIIKSMVDAQTGGRLRCYSDDELGLFINQWEESCDFLVNHNIYTKASPLVFPNPVHDFLFIETNSSRHVNVNLIDFTGHELFRKTYYTDSFQLDLSNLPKGVYFIKLSFGNEILFKTIFKS